MEITGHKTRAVFDRYVDTQGDDLRRVVQQMGTRWTPSAEAADKPPNEDGATT
jgi:hypothetical protein